MENEPLVAVRNLAWSPRGEEETSLFEALDFAVDPGERVALSGPSGSGKTTLLRCMTALERRDAGTLYWRGEPVPSSEIRQFRRRVLYLHQEPVDVAGSIRENLEFSEDLAWEVDEETPRAMDAERQRELLEELGLDGVDWARPFDELSVGERQRVALVRSLTGRPQVLLLDEPTAALDAEHADRLEDLVRRYVEKRPEDRAVVWVSHETERARRIATRRVDIRELEDA